MSRSCVFLNLPPEIVLRIIEYLYVKQTIFVEPHLPGAEEAPIFQMKSFAMGAQLIRTCRQMHLQTQNLLYANNTFNCSQREGLNLLLQSIGPTNFSIIKTVVLDWEHLQDFAWSLAKEKYNLAMAGLEVVEMATWRLRSLDNTSFILRQSKSYERQLCQSAKDICEKHPKLKLVAQRAARKSTRSRESTQRVKWRFITSEDAMSLDEVVVPVTDELSQLQASTDSETGGTGGQEMMDPF